MTTTSEFIMGHSADDATDRKDEAHKVLWAVLAALVVHLVIGYGIATFSGVFSSPVNMEEDKPMEMTIVDLSPPAPKAAQKNSMFMETDESKASTTVPKEKTFESNANSIGASEGAATGEAPLPSQQGKDRPALDLESHNYSLAQDGAMPQPSVAPQETPRPSATPKIESTPAVDQLAMLTSTPTPTVQPSAASTPAPVRSTYRPMKDQTRIAGSITNRGTTAVNAIGTPLGRYQKLVYDGVGSRWYAYVNGKRDLITIGTTRVAFSIDRGGRIKNLKVIENSSNETFANVCLQSVLDIKLPPIPEDVAATLPSEGLDTELTFTMYNN